MTDDRRWTKGEHAIDDEFNDDSLPGTWIRESWSNVYVPTAGWPKWTSSADLLLLDGAAMRASIEERWIVYTRNGVGFTLGPEASGITQAEMDEVVELA